MPPPPGSKTNNKIYPLEDQRFRVYNVLLKDLSSVPRTNTGRFTTTYNSSSTGSDACGLHRHLHSCANTHTYNKKQIVLKLSLKNLSCQHLDHQLMVPNLRQRQEQEW